MDRDASPGEIKRAYRKAKVIYHPDTKESSEKFNQISYAYQILSDPEKRYLYDRYGENGLKNNKGRFAAYIICGICSFCLEMLIGTLGGA